MISTLNIMLDELDCIKRIIDIKLTLIDFPGKIISTKEIDDIRLYFKEFERKIETYLRSFLVEKEKEAKSKSQNLLKQRKDSRKQKPFSKRLKQQKNNFYPKPIFYLKNISRKKARSQPGK